MTLTEKEKLLNKVTKLAEDLEFAGLMRNKAFNHGTARPILPEGLSVRLSELEKELDAAENNSNGFNTPEQWKEILEGSLRPIIHWLDGVGLNLFDEIRFEKERTDNSEALLESIKFMLFDDMRVNTFTQFETWVGDGHALIFKDADGQEYRLTVTREN